eukprot:s2515_g8.t1
MGWNTTRLCPAWFCLPLSELCWQMGWTMSRRCPAWFFLLCLSYHCPLFPPKKKSEEEKGESPRSELQDSVAEHGQVPSQHSELASSRSLHKKLQRAKLMHLLKSDWRRGLCEEVLKFYDAHGRLREDDKRAESVLAKRWHRLLEQKASMSQDLLNKYQRIFAAYNVRDDDGVNEFFGTSHRLPKRQVGDTEEKRAEAALARRWDRLLSNKATINETALNTYNVIFAAAETEDETFHLAVCISVQGFLILATACLRDRLATLRRSGQKVKFFPCKQKLPQRQHDVGDGEEKRLEDALAKRWHRVLAQRSTVSEGVQAQFLDIFEASQNSWQVAVEIWLAIFLQETAMAEVFARCVVLEEDMVQRCIGSKDNDFRAACLAWLLGQHDTGCKELENVSVDSINEFDNTRAFRTELCTYVQQNATFPRGSGVGRSDQEKRLHCGLTQVRKRRYGATRRERAG